MNAPLPADDLRARFDAAPMGRVQIAAIATTALLSALDGYDVLSVTFAAPTITRDWGIDKAQLGVVLSSGLVGMAAGSFLIAPLADVLGRRRLVLASLIVMALGSLGSAFALSLSGLAAWRVVTGLGIGACIAVINPLAAEFANAKARPLAVAVMALGYPVGGLVGGLLAAVLMPEYGWRAVFVAGVVAAIVLWPVAALLLPESPAFLAGRRTPDGLAKLNRLLERCGHPPVAALPPASAHRRGYAGVFAPARIATTARLSAISLLVASVTYYVLSWLPQLVSDAGHGAATGSLVSALLSLAGIVGGLAIGVAATRIGQVRATGLAVVGLGLSIAIIGVASASLPALLAAAALCGFCLFGAAAGFYGVLALGYGDAERASGTGFVIGVGRVSSAIAPLLAGYLFAAGFGRAGVSVAFGCAALAAAALLFTYAARGPAR